MKKIVIVSLLFLVILLLSMAVFFYLREDNKNKVCFKNHCYIVELARTEAERAQGLMQRDKLNDDKGMLFIFNQEGIYPIWMKNMNFALDIIWLNKDFEVVFMAKNVKPCKNDECPNIIPDKLAQYVLEINAGEADRIRLQENDKLNFNLDFRFSASLAGGRGNDKR